MTVIADFVPLPDITAYELAVIVKETHGYNMSKVQFDQAQWDELDQAIKRHFVERK
jgi:hypothetical protein